MKLFQKKKKKISHKVPICINFFRKRKKFTSNIIIRTNFGFTFNKFLDKLKLKFSLFLPQNISYSLSKYKYNKIYFISKKMFESFIIFCFESRSKCARPKYLRGRVSRNNNTRLIITCKTVESAAIKTMALSRETEKRSDDGVCAPVSYTLSV